MEKHTDGDYYFTRYDGHCLWSIVSIIYYPLTSAENDDGSSVIFGGMEFDSQDKIFALCIEGWI